MIHSSNPPDKNEQSRQPKKVLIPEKRTNQEKWYKGIKMEFGELLNYYSIKKELSRGAYGVVYKGVLLTNNKELSSIKVAVKALFPNVHHQLILTELNYLKLVEGNPNFSQLIDFRLANNQFFLVTEYFKHQYFEKFMYSAMMLDIKYYMYSLLKGVDALHKLGIIHRDIKQGNFLYNLKERKGIIIDFGLAEISDEKKKEISEKNDFIENKDIYLELIEKQQLLGEKKIGTEGFMPLEQVLKADKQSYSVDIWSCGVIFFEFLTSKHTIFKNLKLKKNKMTGELCEYAVSFAYQLASIFGSEEIKKLAKFCGSLPEANEDCLDLLNKLLAISPDSRISAEEALNHPFFEEIN